MGNSGLIETSIENSNYPDMYIYLDNITNNDTLKSAYYYALGRERWGAFNINNINWEENKSNSENYFLKTYNW